MDEADQNLSSYKNKPNLVVALLKYARRVGPKHFTNNTKSDSSAVRLMEDTPFPVSSLISDELEESIKELGLMYAMLKYLLPHETLLPALLLYYYECLNSENLLGFASSAAGVALTNGIHMYKRGSAAEKAKMSLYGQNNFISLNRLVSITDAVINGYLHTMLDPNNTFTTKDGKEVNYGFGWFCQFADSCHSECFFDEILESFQDANGNVRLVRGNRCIALGHITPNDHAVNVANMSCRGRTVVALPPSLSKSGTEERYLIEECKCCNLGGNPGKNTCTFVNRINLAGTNVLAREINGEVTHLMGSMESLAERRARFGESASSSATLSALISAADNNRQQVVNAPSDEPELSSTVEYEIDVSGMYNVVNLLVL